MLTFYLPDPKDGPIEALLEPAAPDAVVIQAETAQAFCRGARSLVAYVQVEDHAMRAALDAAGYLGMHQKQPGLMAFERMATWEYPR